MTIDFSAQPGYDGGGGVFSAPDPFADPDLRRWTGNRFHNARFGGELLEDGMTSLISTHPVRATDLLGVNATVPNSEFGRDSERFILYDEEFGPGIPGNFAEWVVDTQNVPPATGFVPQSVTDVEVIIVSRADYSGANRASTFILNDQIISTEVFATGAGGFFFHVESVFVERETWNSLLEASNGYATLGFRSGGFYNHPEGTCQFRIVDYGVPDTEITGFDNAEVTFPHRGLSFVIRGDQMCDPAMIYQFDKDSAAENPMVSYGQGWVVGANEPD